MKQRVEVDGSHIKYPAVKNAFQKANITPSSQPNLHADIVWWDGEIKNRDFENLSPSQRINKIPGMDYICFKSTTMHAFQQMRRMFPSQYNFFPTSFLLPHQFTDLQRTHNYIQGKINQPVTWIVKPRSGCCGNGIKLVQHTYELAHKTDPVVVQRYIPPYLIDGYKFDFRFYILISTLAPYTVYIYKEGLARFCTQQYQPPTALNLNDKFSHLTNTTINKENKNVTDSNFTKLASQVLAQISQIDPKKGPGLWKKICDVSMYALLGIWSSIVGSINNFNSERRLFFRKPTEKTEKALDTFSKYFHVMGIDIMISENLQPIVLELNDRPSMIITYPCENDLKRDMIFDAFSHISIDGSQVDSDDPENDRWVRLLPVNPEDPNAATVTQIITKTANIFRTYAANKERPHYEERHRTKQKLGETFSTTQTPSECQ